MFYICNYVGSNQNNPANVTIWKLMMKRFLQSKHQAISFLLLIIFCFTVPLKNNYNSMSIILLSIFSLISFIIYKNFNKKLFYKLSPLIFFFSFGLISIFYSENFDASLKIIKRLLPFVLFPFIFSILKLNNRRYNQLLRVYSFWMLTLCLYSHSQVLIKLYQNNDILYNIFNNYYSYLSLSEDTIGLHSTYYAYYVIIAIVFITKFLLEEKYLAIKALYILILAYFTFFVFHLSARLPIATLFLFYNLAIVYYFFKQRKIALGITILLLFYIVTSLVIYNVRITRYRFQHLIGFTYSDGTQHDDGIDKLLQWKASIAANNNIVFGNGIGDANQDIVDSYLGYNLKKNAEREYNAHNQFIQTYVGMGLIGLCLLLFIFIYYFKLFYRKKDVMPAILILLTFILYQTESYLERHNGIVMFAFLICLFTLKAFSNREELQHK